MKNYINKLTDTQKGVACIVAGIVLLLDALNVLKTTIHGAIALAAIALIIYGLYIAKIISGSSLKRLRKKD